MSTPEYAIRLQQVSKRYRLGTHARNLRGAIAAIPARVLAAFGRASGRTLAEDRCVWGARNVTLDIQSGESIGIMGPNGAGKTTILKLLAKITYPNEGTIAVNGSLGSLIELGAGFHPDLTGRENIYLNGVILGLSRREVAQRFDSIVEFAGLERFVDTPVKRYSSGMYVRLGFSVAAHVCPDILLVDEVLAVGDIAFRTKCYQKMAELRKDGTTVVLVSHSEYAIRDTCERAIVLVGGEVVFDGSSEKAIQRYQSIMTTAEIAARVLPGTEGDATQHDQGVPRKVRISNVSFLDRDGQVVDTIKCGERLVMKVEFTASERVANPILGVSFHEGGRFITSYYTSYDSYVFGPIAGSGSIELAFPNLYLPTANYLVSVVISEDYEYNVLDFHRMAYTLRMARVENARGSIALPHEWTYLQGPSPGKSEAHPVQNRP